MISRCDNCRLPILERRGRLSSRRGFTTIELLAVIGIIMILGALAFIGLRQVTGTAKAGQTRTTLANLRSMLAELQQASNLSKSPDRWWWPDAMHANPQAVHVANGSDGCDFWRIPHRDEDKSTNPVRPLPAPVGVQTAENADRYRSDAVRNTGVAMGMLLAMPSNRSAVAQMTTDQSQLAMVPWDGTGNTSYAVGQRVGHVIIDLGTGQILEPPRYYACHAPHNPNPDKDPYDPQVPLPSEPGAGSEWNKYWYETSSTLLDAWGQPIIFVPAAGMRVNSGDVVTSVGMASGTDTLPRSGARPFFASAGPDGDFSKTDDNIYSFEN